MPIELNDLETARFGSRCAHVTDLSDLTAVDAQARAMDVAMLSLRISVDDLQDMHRLEARGYRLMDTLVYYARDLTDPLPETVPAPQVTVHLATKAEAATVGMIARAAFRNYIGHYHSDPRLDNAAADAAYVDWAETSTARTGPDSPVLLAQDAGTPCGFLTLRRVDDAEDEIVLNAVHPDHRRTGVYAKLVTEALMHSSARGAMRMIVSTQINNYGAQRVWSHLGFSHSASFYTLHKWMDAAEGLSNRTHAREKEKDRLT